MTVTDFVTIRYISGALQQRPASLRLKCERGIAQKKRLAHLKTDEIWTYAMPLSRAASGGSTNSNGAPWEKLQNLVQLVVSILFGKCQSDETHHNYGGPRTLVKQGNVTNKYQFKLLHNLYLFS